MKSDKYVPVIGDMMVSRWAFEALAVAQFRRNEYQQYWFDIEQRKSNTSYLQLNLIPAIANLIADVEKELNEGQLKTEDVKVINNGLKVINNKIQNPYNYSLNKENVNLSKLKEIDIFLNHCKFISSIQMNEITKIENNLYDNLYLKFNHNDKALLEFKQQNYNNSIADYVLRNNEYKKLIVQNGEIIRKAEPIYYEPENSFGRAHFYASEKRIGNLMIDTFYFNMTVLWIMSLFLYVVLITDALGIFINTLGKQGKYL